MNALQIIQQKLKAPKSQYNSFGKYAYRNTEDVLEALKPLLAETNTILIITDDIVEVAGQLFVEATASLKEIETGGSLATHTYEARGFAKHSDSQSGMNAAQITGSASSYARKYALNGLFLIDDSKDDDATNKHDKEVKGKDAVVETRKAPPSTVTVPSVTLSSGTASTAPSVPTTTQAAPIKSDLPWLNEGSKEWDAAKGKSLDELKKSYRISKANQAKLGL